MSTDISAIATILYGICIVVASGSTLREAVVKIITKTGTPDITGHEPIIHSGIFTDKTVELVFESIRCFVNDTRLVASPLWHRNNWAVTPVENVVGR
jgi:tRNA U34 5-carboxymethylaminomethyl modifying GTPase MnmE/TrmE